MGAACDEPPPPTPAPTAWASATPPLVVANASASSTLSDEDGAANLFDGDADTFWSSDSLSYLTESAWVEAAMRDGPAAVTSVRLVRRSSQPDKAPGLVVIQYYDEARAGRRSALRTVLSSARPSNHPSV